MQGHIRKRTHKTKDGRVTVDWYVVIELPRDADGKRRQKWYGSYRTRKEAEGAQIEILHQINTGTRIEPTSMTFGEWVHATWLPLATQRLKPSADGVHGDAESRDTRSPLAGLGSRRRAPRRATNRDGRRVQDRQGITKDSPGSDH